MIRRGFWLAVGATGGIIGYRRAASLGRSLSGTLMLTKGAEAEQRAPQPTAAGAATAPGAPRPASRGRKTGLGLARQTIRLTRDVRRFGRDIGEGMDLYLARHPGQVGPTLGAVSTRGDAPPEPPEGTDNDERVKDDR